MLNTTESTLVYHSPCFIKVWLQGDQLTIYRSVLVHDDDLPDMVKNTLTRNKHVVVLAEVVEDDNMMFGEGLLSVYRFTS